MVVELCVQEGGEGKSGLGDGGSGGGDSTSVLYDEARHSCGFGGPVKGEGEVDSQVEERGVAVFDSKGGGDNGGGLAVPHVYVDGGECTSSGCADVGFINI